MDKNERQELGANKWRDSKGQGGLQYPTGFGKTYTILNKICRNVLSKDPASTFTIVVHSALLKKQWLQQINEHLPEFIKQFHVDTIQGFQVRQDHIICKVLILDEVDEYFSDGRQGIWKGKYVTYKYLCWLSATPKDYSKRDKEFFTRFPAVDIITQAEALMNGWISQYDQYNWGVELNQEERELYAKYSTIVAENLGKFNGVFARAAKCLQGFTDENGIKWNGWQCSTSWAHTNGWTREIADIASQPRDQYMTKEIYERIQSIAAMWSPDIVMGYAKEMFKYMRARKQLLNDCAAKKDAILDIIKKFPNKKFISFSQSVSFAEQVAELVNRNSDIVAFALHSEIESKPLQFNDKGLPDLLGDKGFVTIKTGTNKGNIKTFGKKAIVNSIIENVKNGKIRFLSTAESADKGFDAPNLNFAIICGQTRNSNQFTQRRGRITRVNVDDVNEVATIVNLYVFDTVEYSTLREAQKQVPKDTINWITSVQEIS